MRPGPQRAISSLKEGRRATGEAWGANVKGSGRDWREVSRNPRKIKSVPPSFMLLDLLNV